MVHVAALGADDVGGAGELELTEHARSFVPALPFGDIDVLIVEQGGKDISGTTMDPNVTGRFWVRGLADFDGPVGGGHRAALADRRLRGQRPRARVRRLRPGRRSPNRSTGRRRTSTASPPGRPGLRRSRMPMVLPDEDACVRAALQMCGTGFDRPKRVVRIRSTLHLTRCWVSDAVLADLPPTARRSAVTRS